MIEQSPALILIPPFLVAILVALVGFRYQKVCFPLTVLSLAGSVVACVVTLM